MSETLNLYQKLLKITEEVGKIEKTGKNAMQGYSFIEQARVVAELRPQLAKWGVFIIPETVSRRIERFENKKGTISVHANVGSRYTVVNADKPEERFISEWDAGEAIDTSDKATNKAATASHKYFLMKLFNISDKDDADSESPEAPGRKYAGAKEITALRQAANNVTGMDNAVDLDDWIGEVVGMPPNKIFLSAVGGATRKIYAKKSKATPPPDEQIHEVGTDTVITDIPDNITLDDLPY